MSDFKNLMIKGCKEVIKEIAYPFHKNPPNKILFDHLPKCGGSSLNEYLEAQYLRRKTFSIDGSHPSKDVSLFKSFPREKRYGYDLVKGHLGHELIDHVDPIAIKVTAFREPIDRIVSHYFYAKRKLNHYLHDKIIQENISLDDYVTLKNNVELCNWYTTHFSDLTMDEIEKNPDSAIDTAFNIISERYDLIGFLSDYTSFAERLYTKAHLRIRYQEKRVNVTKERPSIDKIPTETIEKIKDANRFDIVLYNRLLDSFG